MKEKNKKWPVIIITVIISLSLIISIFAIVLDRQSSTNDVSYGKFSFSFTNTGYRVKINNSYYNFQYFPGDLERINMSSDITSRLQNGIAIVYLFDPNSSIDDLSYSDLVRYQLQAYSGKTTYFGVTQENSNYQGLPILSCANATQSYPIIFLNNSADTGFVLDNNCIIMNAKLKDIAAANERILYGILGVMQ